ncbi:MAG: mannitol-1-phosphate 5-dehydrogenase [Armatimonadetes bacterium]|nr:mannitol-1-phosphate 5-dehydrogenase [Armatimonadota bacterium]
MATAVQFGAGNIGRGFIAQLFHESGMDVVFIDVVQPVVEAINARGEYTIHIVGDAPEEVAIDRVRAVDGRDLEAVAAEIAGCDVACTAVGANALKFLAPGLAAGLERRYREGGAPLNVLVCENLHMAGHVLADHVRQRLGHDAAEEIISSTGFVQAVVARMVPIQAPDADDPLAVRVEAYKRLPVDLAAVRGALPSIVGVEPVERFDAYEARKLYIHNCAHAVLGYLGWPLGIEFGYEALQDSRVRPTLDLCMRESSEALCLRHGFGRAEMDAHVADLMCRFANKALGDTCFRLARDPVRKLAAADRLVGAARMCEEAGIEPIGLSGAIGSALAFNAPDDPVATALQSRIESEGPGPVMRDVAGIDPEEPLGRAALQGYVTALQGGKH